MAKTTTPVVKVDRTGTETITIPVEFVLPRKDVNDLIEFLTNDPDIFGTPYGIGYWAYGIPVTIPLHGRAWLVVEHDDDEVTDVVSDEIEEHAKTSPSMRHFTCAGFTVYILDRVVAMDVIRAHLKRYGNIDYNLPQLDYAIQMALLGEERYA